MDEFAHELKIPKERIAVLIGKSGEIKKELEESTSTSIEIDSKDGDVRIQGQDALGIYDAREVVRAVSRGFNPEIAFTLLSGDNILEVISIGDFIGKAKSSLQRIKGRVIGREGKTRKLIEELTETNVCVYGKTVAIIGEPNNVIIARKAIESLLQGSKHASVYHWLEKKRNDLKKCEPIELEMRKSIKNN